MTKILITGTSFLNKGAAAMLISTSKTLREFIPDAEITMTSSFPEIDSKQCIRYSIKLFDSRSKNPLISKFCLPRCLLWFFLRKIGLNAKILVNERISQEYIKSDVIIDLSGISFTDYFGRASAIGPSLNILRCKLLKKPIVIYSQAMGPFESKLNKFLARIFLNRVDLLVARGEITKRYLQEIGITKQIHVLADSAFLLPSAPQKRMDEILSNESLNESNEKFIGISVNYNIYKWCESENAINKYVSLIVKIVDHLTDTFKNARIIFVPHEITPDGYDDMLVMKEVYQKVKDKHKINMIEKEYSPEELKGIIGQCEFFIGSRFHTIIASTSMCIPTVVIAWSHKYYEVMEMLGQERYVCNYKTTDFDEVLLKINDMIENEKEIKKELGTKIELAKKSALFNGELVRDMLDSLKTSSK